MREGCEEASWAEEVCREICRVLRRARDVRRERSGGVRHERGDWGCWAWVSVGEGERRGEGWPERERRIS